jgi:hypothetical protein
MNTRYLRIRLDNGKQYSFKARYSKLGFVAVWISVDGVAKFKLIPNSVYRTDRAKTQAEVFDNLSRALYGFAIYSPFSTSARVDMSESLNDDLANNPHKEK